MSASYKYVQCRRWLWNSSLPSSSGTSWIRSRGVAPRKHSCKRTRLSRHGSPSPGWSEPPARKRNKIQLIIIVSAVMNEVEWWFFSPKLIFFMNEKKNGKNFSCFFFFFYRLLITQHSWSHHIPWPDTGCLLPIRSEYDSSSTWCSIRWMLGPVRCSLCRLAGLKERTKKNKNWDYRYIRRAHSPIIRFEPVVIRYDHITVSIKTKYNYIIFTFVI